MSVARCRGTREAGPRSGKAPRRDRGASAGFGCARSAAICTTITGIPRLDGLGPGSSIAAGLDRMACSQSLNFLDGLLP
jgi:hypothetical protein